MRYIFLGVLISCSVLAPLTRATPVLAIAGSSTLAATDDGSTGLINIGFTMKLGATSYTQLFVNNNGNISFGAAVSTYTPAALSTLTSPMIAAYLGDVDTRGTGSGVTTYGATTFTTLDNIVRNAFVVNWNNVGYYNRKTDKLDTFQLLFVDRGAGNFDVMYNYEKILWETGDASGGVGGLGGTSARVGFTSGTAASAVEFAGSGTPGALLNGGSKAQVNYTNVPLSGLYTRDAGRYVVSFSGGTGSMAAPTVAPEPSSVVLVGAAVGAFGLLGWRKRRSVLAGRRQPRTTTLMAPDVA